MYEQTAAYRDRALKGDCPVRRLSSQYDLRR